VLLCGGGEPEGARVRGVVRTSSDGSHVYFVAQGVLASGGVNGANNLYAVNTNTEETKFVAELAEPDHALWGESTSITERCKQQSACDAASREAQTTPDGRYLVFSTYAQPSREEPP